MSIIKPIFKTHASLGKSILTSDFPDDKRAEDMADSIFSIAQKAGLKEIHVVENSMVNMFELMKNSLKLGIELRYGLEFKVGTKDEWFKQTIMAANAQGVRDLMALYSLSQTEHDGRIPEGVLADLNCSNFNLLCNFYDGWIHKNLLAFGTFMPNFPVEPWYQVQNHDLPIDHLIEAQIRKVASRKIFRTHTILYNKKEDVDAFMIYKLACDDKMGGRRPTHESPNLDGFCSDSFSWEYYEEKCN